MSNAIDWLCSRYREPLDLAQMAAIAQLKVPALRNQFNASTAMSPLQFQKHLRMQAARRLVIHDRLDPTHAGRQVGYACASQFSRAYTAMFGVSPAKDAVHIRRDWHGPLPHLGE